MFATYETLKLPVQFGDGSTTWRGVEVILGWPWLLATLEDGEVDDRTFLLQDADDLLRLVESSNTMELTGVRIVLPPAVSSTSDWAFVSVCRIERELKSFDDSAPGVVLTSRDGRRYGGFPIGQIERADSDLTLLVDLPMAAM
jgi:hypothetical protein